MTTATLPRRAQAAQQGDTRHAEPNLASCARRARTLRLARRRVPAAKWEQQTRMEIRRRPAWPVTTAGTRPTAPRLALTVCLGRATETWIPPLLAQYAQPGSTARPDRSSAHPALLEQQTPILIHPRCVRHVLRGNMLARARSCAATVRLERLISTAFPRRLVKAALLASSPRLLPLNAQAVHPVSRIWTRQLQRPAPNAVLESTLRCRA